MIWHRFEDVHYAAPVDEFDRPMGEGTIKVEHREYEVLKETPKGVWLNIGFSKTFVRRDAKRQFASPTVEQALEKFLRRKERQLAILRARMRSVEVAISQADEIKFKANAQASR